MSADKGNEYAMFNYAVMLRYGNGVTLDKNEAEKYFNVLKKIGKFDELRKLGEKGDLPIISKHFSHGLHILTDFE